MAPHNPYAPSSASLGAGPASAGGGPRVWREGRLVVALLDAPLPDRCVKCNQPAAQPTKERTLYWHHPAHYLWLVVAIILYIVIASIKRRAARVAPGLCHYHKRRRTLGVTIAWLCVLTAIGLLFTNLQAHPEYGLISIGLFLVACIIGAVATRLVYAKEIDDEYVRLGGICREYREQLPEFPRLFR